MLTLNDGRSELWQWDTGRKLNVDVECSQVHFSNKVFGRSVDVDVVGGTAIIPDFLLQADKDILAWGFVGSPENGYTKISKVFKVNRRNKPSEYVFTPVDQMTMAEISAIAQSVRNDADAGKFNGKPGEPGAPGKSAYQYALDGGYTGTEEEFAEKLASESGGVTSWNDLTDRPFYSEPAFETIVFPDSFVNTETWQYYHEPINLGALAGVEEMLFYKGNVSVSDVENYIGAIWKGGFVGVTRNYFTRVDEVEVPEGVGLFNAKTIFLTMEDDGTETWDTCFNVFVLVVSKENEYGIPVGVYEYGYDTPGVWGSKGTISKTNYIPIPDEYLPSQELLGTIEINSTNSTLADKLNIRRFTVDLQEKVKTVFSKCGELNKSIMLTARIAGMAITCSCVYVRGGQALGFSDNLQFYMVNSAEDVELLCFSLRASFVETNYVRIMQLIEQYPLVLELYA